MAESTPARTSKPEDQTLVLRSWPKIILMIPTLIVAFICGLIMAIKGMPSADSLFGAMHWVGMIFLIVVGVNLTVVLYDLSLRGFIVVALLIAVMILTLSLLDRSGRLWSTFGKALSFRAVANGAFYFVFCILLLFNLAIAWVITRFNYWKIERNEIIIHRGFMQEQERHPTAQARFKLQIEDVVEYGILGTGTLVFYFGDDQTEHQLTTVPFVHRKAKKLDELLGRIAVTSTS